MSFLFVYFEHNVADNKNIVWVCVHEFVRVCM